MLVLKRSFLILSLALALTALSFAPLLAQDEAPTEPAPADTSGMDPVTTPAPLPTRLPRLPPLFTLTEGNATLELFFQTLPQGETGLAHVSGPGVAGARARFLDEMIEFFPIEDDGFYGLLSADMEAITRRSTDLAVFVWYEDGTRSTINTQVEIVLGGFITQLVTLAPDKGYLLDIETERNELARLESIFANITETRLWDETGFQMPILSGLTSPFGAFRTFNGALNTRHTGWDIRTTLGVPVMASAGGRVVFSGPLEIRGSHVVVDHGYGVFSGYSHLSQVHVTRGQMVTKGQIIGTTGDTGRTSGPHFHWEMAVNGNWVDSVQFIELWMP